MLKLFRIFLLLCFCEVFTFEVPAISCPHYFQYLRYGDQYIGKVTLPNLSMGTTFVEIQFSQRVPVQSNYYGRLSLFQDQQTTISYLQNNIPIAYRVDFPISNVLPKLTRIAVNGYDICRGTDYPPPSTMLKLQHTLQASAQPLQGSSLIPTQRLPPTFEIQGNPYFQQPAIFPTPKTQPTVSTRAQTPTAPVPSTVVAPVAQNAQSVCGREGNSITPFIHGGTVLSRGQFPWLAPIYKKESSGLRFICGGSLISSRTIITAAHCFRLTSLTADRVVVYLGRYNLENYSEDGVIAREIRALITHPEYNPNSFSDADLAILQLQAPVSFTQYITPICLWSESADVRYVVGQKAYVAGWGADERGNSVSPLPKMVDASIVSEGDCLRSSDAFKSLTSRRTLCAGNRDGTGPCMGDSGSGLMLNRNGRWMLRGVVSAGNTMQSHCNLQEYVIYCDLAQHITWVRANMLT